MVYHLQKRQPFHSQKHLYIIGMKHSLVTIANLSKEKIMYLIEMAQAFEKIPTGKSWTGKSSQRSSSSRQRVRAFRLKRLQTASALVSLDSQTPR